MSCVCSYFSSRSRNSAVDRKSTRLNSSHVAISYAVFCLKKKKKHVRHTDRNRKTKEQNGRSSHVAHIDAYPRPLLRVWSSTWCHKRWPRSLFFFFNDTAPTEIYTLSLHDALPI